MHLSVHLFLEQPPNGVYEPVDDSRPSTKRGHSDETSPQAQASKKPRASRKGKEPAEEPISREGCPGDNWGCFPDSVTMKGRAGWGTYKQFENHFKAQHLQGCRTEDNRWQCPVCKEPSFGGNGVKLMKHLYDDHWR